MNPNEQTNPDEAAEQEGAVRQCDRSSYTLAAVNETAVGEPDAVVVIASVTHIDLSGQR